MGLKAWWKLDGDATDSIKSSNDGVTTDVTWTEGKLGGAANFNGTTSIITIPDSPIWRVGGRDFSVSTWVYPIGDAGHGLFNFFFFTGEGSTSHQGWQMKLGGLSGVHSAGRYPIVRLWSTESSQDISFTEQILPDSQWSHVSFSISRKRGLCTLYINGNMVASKSITTTGSLDPSGIRSLTLGAKYVGTPHYLNGMMDDVRIFDHAISTKEAQEIARGKVAHWKFSDLQEPTINLISSMSIVGHGSSWTLTGDKYRGIDIYRNEVTAPDVSNNFGFRHTASNVSIPVTATHISISFFAKMVTPPNAAMKGYVTVEYTDATQTNHNWTYAPVDWDSNTDWVYVTSTITLTAGKVPSHIVRFYVYADFASYGTMDVAGIQMETKSHSTSWTPTERGGVIADASGHQESIVLPSSSMLRWDPDVSVGNYSLYSFDGDVIEINDDLLGESIDELTVALWVKTTHNGDWTYYVHRGNTSNIGGSVYWLGTSNTGFFGASVNGAYVDGTTGVAVDGDWHHLALTWDGNTQRVYVDGNLEASSAVASIINTTSTRAGIGGSPYNNTLRRAVGLLSDIRIYATALSSEAISELVNQRGSLDSGGRFYTKTIEESLTLYDPDVNNFNLLENGTQKYENNYNFPSFTYRASGDCLELTSGSATVLSSNFIPIQGNDLDSWEQYTLEGEVKGENEVSRYYFMIVCYDRYLRTIGNADVNSISNTETVLVQDLIAGDEWVYLQDTTNWFDNGVPTYDHRKGLALWHPDDEYVYTPYKYTKRWLQVAEVDKANHRVRLNSLYSGTTIPSGSFAQNHQSGSTYSYIGASNAITDLNNWVFHTAATSVTPSVGNVRYGTSYVRVGFLINREATNPTTLVRNMRLYNSSSAEKLDSEFDKNQLIKTGKQISYELNEVKGTAAGLVGWLPLSASEKNISIHQITPASTSITFGNVGSMDASIFNGSTSFVHIPSQRINPQHMTLSFWLRLNSGQWGARFDILSGTSASSVGRLLLYRLNTTTLQFYVFTDTANTIDITGADSLFTDTWRMVTLVSSDVKGESLMKAYIDGLEVASGVISTEYTYSNQDLYLMSDRGVQNFTAGAITDFRAYDRPLDAGEIETLYQLSENIPGTISKKFKNELYIKGSFNEVYL